MKKSIRLLLLIMAVSLAFVGCTKKVDSTSNASKKSESLSKFESIDTDKVKEALESEDWVVVDTRLNDAFNGWKLDGVSRGGHIEGATDFSANWLKVEDKKKEEILEEALDTKGITKEKNIVLYDANKSDARLVADYLGQKGYKNVFIYDI